MNRPPQQQQQMDVLLQCASATLGSGNIREAVKLPLGEDPNEWVAANVADFFNQLSMLYGTITEKCTATSCPRMTASARHEYYWASPTNVQEPMDCPAPVYIDHLFSWVQDQLDDENTFPSQIGKQFPPDFWQIACTIMKRLFRVYAHVYYQHFQQIEQMKAVEHVNTSFKHFMLFVKEFNLIEAEEQEPLAELIEKLVG